MLHTPGLPTETSFPNVASTCTGWAAAKLPRNLPSNGRFARYAMQPVLALSHGGTASIERLLSKRHMSELKCHSGQAVDRQPGSHKSTKHQMHRRWRQSS